MLSDLDPYTNYITESDIEEYEFMTTGKYGGIGASMRKKDDNIYIGDVYENSPSQKAGLHPGDILISIDGQSAKGKSIEELSQLLKGSPGTPINIRVKDAYNGQEVDKMVTRGEVELSSVPYAGFTGADKSVGYVKLNQFTMGCARQVRNALDSLKTVKPDMKSVVLDLRNNPGGLLDEAVNLCNIFIDRNQLVVSVTGNATDVLLRIVNGTVVLSLIVFISTPPLKLIIESVMMWFPMPILLIVGMTMEALLPGAIDPVQL
ncbi:PDZ/DHR/GLGF domain protein [Ostertagia ostertagi]